MTKAKFKIGDKVKVTNFGQTYTTYEYMFELMGFKDTRYNGSIKNKDVGTIFGVQLHENQDVLLYAIRTADDREALIGEEGLIKVAPPKEEPKQETLEEVAERLYPINNTGSIIMPSRNDMNNLYKQQGFITGAKWQQDNSNINALYFEIDALKKQIELLKYQQEVISLEEYAKRLGIEDNIPTTLQEIQEYMEEHLDWTIWDYPLEEYDYALNEVHNGDKDELVLVQTDFGVRVCEI